MSAGRNFCSQQLQPELHKLVAHLNFLMHTEGSLAESERLLTATDSHTHTKEVLKDSIYFFNT